MREYPITSPQSMYHLGTKIGLSIQSPTFLSLQGDLGSGKTTFTKGLAYGLGIQDIVTSPTFAIMNQYQGGRIDLYHLDFYRLSDGNDLFDLGWEDLIQENAVIVVEWGDLFKEHFPKACYTLHFQIFDETTRILSSDSEWISHVMQDEPGL